MKIFNLSVCSFLCLILSVYTAYGLTRTDTVSTGKITGVVLDDHQKALAYATLTLIKASDSVFVINALSDTAGKYQFTAIKAGTYRIKVTAMGYQSFITNPISLRADEILPLKAIVLAPLTNTLNEVQITASRPAIETKRDRLVMNVENSPLASGNSLQLLKSAPFVQVSSGNVVSLQGKRTMILIDNKPVPDAALEDILLALPSGNILKVELITNPSAKYDAAYGAVINITTKKSLIEGITGNVRAEGSAGLYGRGDLNSQVTYKHQGLTLYGGGGLNIGDNLFEANSERILGAGNSIDILMNKSRRLAHNRSYNFKAGADFTLDKNQTLGVQVNGNIVRPDGPWPTITSFRKQGSGIDSVLNTNSNFDLKLSTFTYSANYHLVSDSGKNDLTILAAVTPFKRNLFQYFPSELVNASGGTLKIPSVYQTINTSDIKVYSTQLDYIHTFDKKWTLESGLKYQYTDSKSAVNYQANRNGSFETDPRFSNDNTLTESIAGAYAILSKDWKKDKIQAGMRMENTRADYTGNRSQDYFNVFPTFIYQHTFSDDYNLSFSYKRSIARAPYAELVPYTVFINQYNIEQGNPDLKPQYDHIYTIGANIKKINLSLSYTDAQGMFALFPRTQDPITKVTAFSRQNINKFSDFSLYLFFPLKLTSWWETQNSGTVLGYNKAEGNILGSPYDLSAFRSDFRSAHIFTISKNIKLQVDAYYWTHYVQDLSRYSGNKNFDASLLVNILAGKGQIRLSGSEIVFKRNDYRLEQYFNGYSSRESFITDSKRVSLGFTYKFGKTTVKSTDKQSGNEDAVKRL
jgi:iron complex outermembrane recepter protein